MAFLDEAAVLLGRPALGGMAALYRGLGKDWTAFADFLLPKPFAETKKAMAKLAAVNLAQIENLKELREAPFPWDAGKIAVFLDEASGRLGAVYEREVSAAKELVGAVI